MPTVTRVRTKTSGLAAGARPSVSPAEVERMLEVAGTSLADSATSLAGPNARVRPERQPSSMRSQTPLSLPKPAQNIGNFAYAASPDLRLEGAHPYGSMRGGRMGSKLTRPLPAPTTRFRTTPTRPGASARRRRTRSPVGPQGPGLRFSRGPRYDCCRAPQVEPEPPWHAGNSYDGLIEMGSARMAPSSIA
jgi:hypothetical protein